MEFNLGKEGKEEIREMRTVSIDLGHSGIENLLKII